VGAICRWKALITPDILVKKWGQLDMWFQSYPTLSDFDRVKKSVFKKLGQLRSNLILKKGNEATKRDT
jgi:hypothetical protein